MIGPGVQTTFVGGERFRTLLPIIAILFAGFISEASGGSIDPGTPGTRQETGLALEPRQTSPVPIPETLTLLLFGTGLASLGIVGRHRLGMKGSTIYENSSE